MTDHCWNVARDGHDETCPVVREQARQDAAFELLLRPMLEPAAEAERAEPEERA